MNNPKYFSKFPLAILATVFLAGCGTPRITTYTIPKEDIAPKTTPAPAKPAKVPIPFIWTLPTGWTQTTGSGMRVATITVPGKSKPLDMSVVQLSGQAGGLLANINRWRGQLNLQPIKENELSKLTIELKSDAFPITLTELTSDSTSILGGIFIHQDHTWFFKLTGPTEEIRQTRRPMIKFLTSIRPK